MKNILITFTLLCASSAIPIQASLILDLQRIPSLDERTASISNLDASPPSITSDDNDIVISSGSLSNASDLNNSETIGIRITAVNDWNFSVATDDSITTDTNTYLSNLKATAGADFDGNNGGWGVDGSGDSDSLVDLDSGGEAFLLEFTISSLPPQRQLDFRLTGLGMDSVGTGDIFNYAVFDSTGNTISASASNQAASSFVGDLNLTIGNGDTIVFGHGGGSFRFASFSINMVPEPSTAALLGLGLSAFGWGIRRRRHQSAATQQD